MNTTKKKNRKKINVIDAVIILLVLALLSIAAYRIYDEITKNTSGRQSQYILTFESEVDYDNVLDYLKNGDAVYLSSDGTLIGYLYDKPDDGMNVVYKVTDEEKDASSSKIRLKGALKLTADALKSQNGEYFVINGKNISNGSTLKVYTEKAVLTITVKSIGTGSAQ